MAVIAVPLVLLYPASKPTAVLLEAVLEYNALFPNATLALPVTLLSKALNPNEILFEPVVFE